MALMNDIVTRLYLNGDWRDISTHVRAEQGITYSRGRGPEDATTPPQTCSLVLDNGPLKGNGAYTERNPLGQWYGYLKRFTPASVALRLVKDTCTATASNGWGSTDTHAQGAWNVESWSTSGGAASDYAKAAGKATHLLSGAGQARVTYLSNFRARDIGVKLTVSASISNVTGSSLTAGMNIANIMLRGQGAASTYYYLRLLVQTDESITMDFVASDGTSLTNGDIQTSSLTYSSADSYYVRAEIEGRALRAKIWKVGTSEPFGYLQWAVDEGDVSATTSIIEAQGWVGIRSALVTGNTNTNVTVSYDDIEIYSPIATGEVIEWPQARDTTGRDQTVRITIGGPKRRLAIAKTIARSALYQAILVNPWGSGFFPFPDAYYPLEDGTQADTLTIAPSYGRGRLTYRPDFTSGTVNRLVWGADTSLPGTKQAPALSGGSALIAFVEPVTDSSSWLVTFQVKHNYADGWFVTMGTAEASPILIDFSIAANATVMNIDLFSAGIPAAISYDYGTKENVESWHSYHFWATQTGPDILYALYIDGVFIANATQSGATLQGMHRVHLGTRIGSTGNTYYGHLAIYGSFGLNVNEVTISNAAGGNLGEAPVYRAKKVAEGYGFNFDWIGFGGLTGTPGSPTDDDGKPMGAQRVVNVADLLDDAEKVDGGLLYEQRSRNAFQFRTLRSMAGRSSFLTLDMGTSKHLTDLTPVPDERGIVNRFTARRADGGEYVYSLDSGAMSTLSPDQGGIGVVDRGDSFNVSAESDLADIASYRVARGTIDQERYPRVVVELHRSAVYGTSGLLAKLRDLDIGDQITLSGMASNGIYDDRDELVLGIQGQLDQKRHTLTLATEPAELLRVWTLGSTTATATEFSRVDSDSTTIDEDLTTTETDVTIRVASGAAFWIDSATYADQFPFDVVVGGERMTVTAGTAPSGQNQTWTVTRSVNGVVKAHSTGAKISLYRPNYLGL